MAARAFLCAFFRKLRHKPADVNLFIKVYTIGLYSGVTEPRGGGGGGGYPPPPKKKKKSVRGACPPPPPQSPNNFKRPETF